MSEHYGQWQAQGDDMPTTKGRTTEWGQDSVPDKNDGLAWLMDVAEQCTAGERARREARACPQAVRFVMRCPPEGHPLTSKHFYARDDRYKNARIDLEIYGRAFCDGETR